MFMRQRHTDASAIDFTMILHYVIMDGYALMSLRYFAADNAVMLIFAYFDADAAAAC